MRRDYDIKVSFYSFAVLQDFNCVIHCMSYTEKIAEWCLGAAHLQSLFLMPVAPFLAQRQKYEFTTAQIPPYKMERQRVRFCCAPCKSKDQVPQIREKGSDADLSHACLLLNLNDSNILYT